MLGCNPYNKLKNKLNQGFYFLWLFFEYSIGKYLTFRIIPHPIFIRFSNRKLIEKTICCIDVCCDVEGCGTE